MKIIVGCEGEKDIGPIACFMKKCAPNCNLDIDCKTHTQLRNIKLLKNEIPRGIKKENNKLKRVAFIRRLF